MKPIGLACALLVVGTAAALSCSDDDGGTKPPEGDAAPVGPDAPTPSCENPVQGVPNLTVERVANGFANPVFAVVPPGDTRIFVVEQPGVISYIENGKRATPAFFDISGTIGFGGERGLLGLAFHPKYVENKRFYVYYTKTDGTLQLSEFTATTVNDADEKSEKPLLSINHPATNHNGGWLGFGPDGFLYMGTGDGGGGGDPDDNGLDTEALLGKMLRLDVDTAGQAKPAAGNPFIGKPGRDEIWAYGLRNPWRSSFDRQTGDLYIADVGQNKYEEVNVQPKASKGAENYGWDAYEGLKHCYENQTTPPEQACNEAGKTWPVYEYTHDIDGDGQLDDGGSITGGYVYRGCKMPGLHGTYFFGDAVHSFVRSFKWNGAGASTDLKNHAFKDVTPYGFGEDALGEVLICDANGDEVLRIVPAP